MKQAFRLSRLGAAAAALALVALCGALVSPARAQTASATPDSVIVQIANTASVPSFTPTPAASPSPAPSPVATQRNTFALDTSGNGRFVVMESTGDISTERTASRNNLDGNIEIFLFDYAQRRIFQITSTRHALKDTNLSPQDPTNVEVDVRNLRPMISRDGRYVVFSSNAYSDAAPALTPKNFDGEANEAALKADGNMEIFIYEVPAVADADLSAGGEVAVVDLTAGAMTRVTNTPASRLPTAGGVVNNIPFPPTVADDNREVTLNDDGSRVVFISTRNLANVGGVSNADQSPEVFAWVRASSSFVQVTNTALTLSDVNQNPNISGDGSVIAFSSSYDLGANETTANRGNQEIYVANFNGTAVSNLRAVTQTLNVQAGGPVNIFSPGRRLSRNGQFVAFESRVDFAASGAPLTNARAAFMVRLSDNSVTQIAPRVPVGQIDDLLRFPAFTGDSSTILFASTLNLRASNGEALAIDSTEGINPGASGSRRAQIFAVAVPGAGQSPANYQRLTNLNIFASVAPLPSDTFRRSSFSLAVAELGGGNADQGSEAYYLLVPAVTAETTAPTVSFFTGASERPVAAASPQPSPPAVTALAPGMLGIVRASVALAASTAQVDRSNAEEATRRPPLPVELNGVTISIGGAGAGLYFISPNQINFVIGPGAVANRLNFPVVINNNGTVVRSTLDLVPSQPDIFTTSNGPGGRAAVLNVTNPCFAATGEPFTVRTTRPTGGVCSASTTEEVATELLIMLTGVRNATPSQITVTIGTTAITGAGIVSVGPSRTSGFDQIVVRLPESLANAGDVPVVVTVANSAGTFTSLPAESAPRITITQ